MHTIKMAARFETCPEKNGRETGCGNVVKSGPSISHFLSAFTLVVFFCLIFSTLSARAQSNKADAYTWTTFAGNSGGGSTDGVGGDAQFRRPIGVALDTNGNMYVTDSGNQTIRRITQAGIVTTIAGFAGISGNNDGIGIGARFSYPAGITIDGNGTLYVADYGNDTIRKIVSLGTNWVVSTIAGSSGIAGSFNGTGTNAQFFAPTSLTVDKSGNIYVTDFGNDTIRKITPIGTNWVVSTIAGLVGAFQHQDGGGTNARFAGPIDITLDDSTNLYVAESSTIRKIVFTGSDWSVSTLVGQSQNPGVVDGTNNFAQFDSPGGIAVDKTTNLYVADTLNNTIRKITPIGTNWVTSTLVGKASVHGFVDGVGTNALFNAPSRLTVDSIGTVLVADSGNNAIRNVTTAGMVWTIAGGWEGGAGTNDGTGGAARFNLPQHVAVDVSGNIFVADTANNIIRKITSAGIVFTLAGLAGNSGMDDGVGSNSRFNQPLGITVDIAGNIYVADRNNYEIRQIYPSGIVNTIVGKGVPGFFNDGTNTDAGLGDIHGIAVGQSTNLFITDNNGIRMITRTGTNWVVTTIAGQVSANLQGSLDGIGTNALFNQPQDIAVDNADNLYVADTFNNTIRMITRTGTNWIVSTIAGSPDSFGSNDGIGTNAQFSLPLGIAVDASANVYVADGTFSIIRKLTQVGSDWVVTTIGGSSSITPGSYDGVGSLAQFDRPSGLAVDMVGNVYVADQNHNTIRKGVFTAYSFANKAASSLPVMNSSLMVTLFPTNINGQWRFPWEIGWHNSGYTATNLAAGDYPVEFRSIPGWLTIPLSTPVTLGTNDKASITNQYYLTTSTVETNNGGSLTINLGPNPPVGAGWRFLGDTNAFYPSLYTTNLIAGTYLIEFAPVSGRSKPSNLSVQIQPGLPTYLFENYPLATTPPSGVLLPFPVPYASIGDLDNYPFGFNGQLQSDVGYGSGVAVDANVVLTAAHLIFNDQTLSYVSHAYWYFREEKGVYEPQPQEARGWYVLSGYATQRTNDLGGLGGIVYGPDQSSPDSRNLDVAALYFNSPVAGGSYGGYLPSDQTPNSWLTGNALKMLVGYPVDGSLFGFTNIVPGMMYQTDPQPYPLDLSSDPTANAQEVYTSSKVLSYPGNSGGPVYVQFNGYYYPAGVYLGTVTGNRSAVRAIDSAVVNLITNAATLVATGTNYAGGGVITIVPNQAISAFNPGYIQFRLTPPAAVSAGAGWRLTGDAAYSSATNYTRAVLSTNAFSVEFKSIAGWNVPTNATVVVVPGVLTTNTAFYSVTNPLLKLDNTGLGITGTMGTVYRLESRTSLTSGSWLPVKTNTITTNGFNLLLANPATNGSANFYRAVWLP